MTPDLPGRASPLESSVAVTALPLTAGEDRILEGLSSAQREAVLHGEGPLLIIAGAGTGKTTVLTRRIAHLISSKVARPEEILALTFTEKAAVEMAERVDQLIPYGYAETWISTFHAFGDRILREGALDLGLHPDFRVLSQPEEIVFLRERIFDLPLRRFRPLGDPARHLHALIGHTSRAKDEDVSPEQYRAHAEAARAAAKTDEAIDEADKQLELAAFYEAQQRLLAEAGFVDFGDQIHRALDLLRRRPAVLARLRARYRYVLVDEFQDTNKAQLELLRLVAGESANLTVVGDDDQAIYRWRGAAAANLLAFRHLYPSAREVVLVENHRSTQPILDASARLISYNNPHRLGALAGIDKRLRAQRPGGVPVRHLHYDTVSAEADGVAALVAERIQAGFRPRDIAVLVRSNGDADPFLRALNVKGIPHRFSGSRGLYAREEVRLLVHFLRVLASPEDSVSLFYLAASEVYRVPEADLIRLNQYSRRKSRPLIEVMRGLPENEDLASVTGAARESLARLLADHDRAVAEVPHRRTGEVLYGFLQWSGVLAALAREESAGAEARVRNIARFFETVKAYGEVAAHDRVPAFVSHLDLLREAGDDPAVAEADVDEDAVHVLTVHKAKGLEFPLVFLVGGAEDRFPLRRRGEGLALPEALGADEDAMGGHHREERRLFYVAMTRAKDELVLTSAADYGSGRPRKVSRFVIEALDLPSPAPVPRKSQAQEALRRHQPAPEPLPGPGGAAPRRRDPAALLPPGRRLRDLPSQVPLRPHPARPPADPPRSRLRPRRARGRAPHVRGAPRGSPLHRRRPRGRLQALVGFGRLPVAHPRRAASRCRGGRAAALPRGGGARSLGPHGGRAGLRLLRGPKPGGGPVRSRPRSSRSRHRGRLQDGRRPDRREGHRPRQGEPAARRLRPGLAPHEGSAARPGRAALSRIGAHRGTKAHPRGRGGAEARIAAAAAAIRRRDFAPRPTFAACGQCPFRDICPHTVSTPDAEG